MVNEEGDGVANKEGDDVANEEGEGVANEEGDGAASEEGDDVSSEEGDREEDDCPMCHVKLKDSLVNGFVVTIVILGFIPTALKQNLDCLPDIFYCSKCV